MRSFLIILLLGILYGCGDSTTVAVSATCNNSDRLCIGGTCNNGKCISFSCTPREDSCIDDETLKRCREDQTGFEEITCDFRCISGSCVDTYICKSGEKQCLSDTSFRTCGANRLSWDEKVCDAGTYCIDGSCVTPICTPGEKLCSDQYSARECNQNGTNYITHRCDSGEVCIDSIGECHTLSCIPGEMSCKDGELVTCNVDGSGWESQQSCDSGKSCDPDKSCGELCCDNTVCTPDEKRCSESSDFYVEICNPLGTGWMSPERCDVDQSCSEGTCLPMVCTPGGRDCSGNNEIVNCSEDGLTYEVVEACSEGDACDQGRCLEQICEADQTGCDPNNSQYFRKCNSTGTGFSESIRCGIGSTCIAESGQCEMILCTEGQQRCAVDGKSVEICNENHTDFMLQTQCGDHQLCVNNSCITVICSPGATRCSGTQVEICNEDGSAWGSAVNCPDSGEYNQICLADRCQSLICTPGEKSCVEGADYIQFFQTCNETGTGWIRKSCESGQACIDNGSVSCQEVLCIPGQSRCIAGEERVEQCRDDGMAYVVTESCSGDQFCQLGSCVDQVCVPDTLVCGSTTTIQRCDSRGSRLSDPISCGDGLLCGDQGSGDQCYPKPCSSGDSICRGTQIQYCNSTETDWDDPVNCADGGVCAGNSCQEVICSADQYSCFNSAMRQRCNSTGTAYETPVACNSGEVCSAGNCIPKVCDQGDIECQDSKNYHVCNSSGTAFEYNATHNSCQNDQLCDGDKDRCMDVICTAGSYRCSSNGSTATSQRCNATGTSWGAVVNCTSAQVCTEANGCETKVCEPYEEFQCITEGGTDYHRCNIDGTGYQSTTESCPSGYLCKSQECVRVICNPGDIVCVPGVDGDDSNSYHVCNSDGTGYEADVPCGGSDLCYAGACRTRCEMAAMNQSYMGCDYYAVELRNYFGTYSNGTYAIIVSNPSEFEANVTINGPNGSYHSAEIDPGSLEIFRFCEFNETTEHCISGTDIYRNQTGFTEIGDNFTYHIESDLPVVAYQFSPLGGYDNYTNDASILIPTTAYGTTYRMMSWEHYQKNSSEITPQLMTIIARDDDTSVTVQVTATTRSGDSIAALSAGETISRTLQAGEMLQLASLDPNLSDGIAPDLTGSLITADKPIGVFGSNALTQIPLPKALRDHVEQQLFPVNTWGSNYLMVKMASRNALYNASFGTSFDTENDYYKFVAHEDNTVITFSISVTDLSDSSAITSKTLDAGEHLSIKTPNNFMVSSTKPVMAAQFISSYSDINSSIGANDPEGGDPAFILSVPTEQFRKDYLYLVPDTYGYNFATVIAPANSTILRTDFNNDGSQRGSYSYTVASDTHFKDLSGTNYRYAIFDMGNKVGGSFSFVATEPIGISVYGYDGHVSYGYPAGLDLKSIK